MRIEKVNENQIRCVLTREDLADRQIKLSELAYGSEKAKTLFREMIQQASYEVGFEADDVPLMVEAIPVSAESIILVITKVEYPDELDTRFSKFTEPEDEAFSNDSQDSAHPESNIGAMDVIDFFEKVRKEALKMKNASEGAKETKMPEEAEGPKEKPQEIPAPMGDLTKMFVFRNMEQLERVSCVLAGFYHGKNSLFKDERKNAYVLFLHKSEHSPEEFNKVCNMISEYAVQKSYSSALGAHFSEHCKCILRDDALQVLATL